MSIEIVQERLNSYNCRSSLEEEHALREISQEIVLAALARTDFFKHAVFQGGTCLRIFYSLNRFSEDLDFILKNPDTAFTLEAYYNSLVEELSSFGYQLRIQNRSTAESAVKKAFLKENSMGNLLQLTHLKSDRSVKKLKIKLEVDTNPPANSQFEAKYYDFPFAFSAALQNLPSLFAGKLHALLCRQYIKGRDWYDFAWYISRKTTINYQFLAAALNQNGPWAGKSLRIDLDWCVAALKSKVETISWEVAKNDVKRFIRQTELPSIDIWGKEYFLDCIERLSQVENV
ncbi:MAG: nucleotidyl transferase AbiEii/AbiGii toxin family protein [Kiritimatiellaeota bacterium]|nr:nucleotidyl transferase AbiEii/AbiGii toxin family protein [Kiritimatiellota bacterium]